MNRSTMSVRSSPPWVDTAPPITRSPMKPRPWLGFTRSLMHALWHALWHLLWPARAARTPIAWAPWQQAATRRRRTLLAAVLLLSAGGTALLLSAHQRPVDAWPRALQVVLFALLFAWVSASFVTALMGAWVLWRGDGHALIVPSAYTPIDAQARTALIVPICNEDIATVFGGLRATCESLAATGALRLFDIYILSDTTDPALRRAEVEAWEKLRVLLRQGKTNEALVKLTQARDLDVGNWRIRKQIWALEHPDKFYGTNGIDWGWQKEQIVREKK